MFKKIVAFFHAHPGIKTTVVGGVGTLVTAAGSGMFGPKGAAVAGALTTVWALFVRRPQDTKNAG